MANYIDKEIICEAYVHLDISDDVDVAAVTARLKRFFDDRVRFLLGDSVETEMETAEGSLKVKLTAYAGIATIIGAAGAAVLNYTGFRDNLKAIYEDSRMLAEATNLETIFATRTPVCDRIHSESRTGVVGRAAKILTQIETFKASLSGIDAPSNRAQVRLVENAAAAVSKLDEDVRRLLEKVKSDDDRFCLAKGFHSAFAQLPEKLTAETMFEQDQFKKSLLKESNLDILAASAFHRYTASIRSAKEGLKRLAASSKPKSA